MSGRNMTNEELNTVLYTNFLRICSFLLCKHPYKFYLKIVSKKLLRDDL